MDGITREEFKDMWKVLSRIERQNAVILSKFEEGHQCLHEKEIQSLNEFKENNKNSVSRNQAIIFIIFTALLGFLLGFIANMLR